MYLDRILVGLLLGGALGACTANGSETPAPTADVGFADGGLFDDAGTSDGGFTGDAGTSTDGSVDYSSRSPSLKRKSGEMLALDFAQALGLSRGEVCVELGSHDCASEAHRIVLGGVEPYQLRIDEPLPGTPLSAPIAVDRLALSACEARAAQDFAQTQPLLFGPLLDGSADARSLVVDTLYERFLGRAPDPEERTALAALGGSEMSDRDFAVLSCFVVGTTLEHLFY